MPTNVAAQRLCPHCGAKVDAIWTSCWMCGLELPEENTSAPTNVVRRAAEPSFPAHVVAYVPWLLGGLILLMLIGLCADGNWGAAIGFLIFLAPAAVYTFVKSRRQQESGTPMTGATKFGTFLVSLAVTIGCVFAVGLAAFIALFVICIAALSNADFR